MELLTNFVHLLFSKANRKSANPIVMRTEKGKGGIFYELDKKATIWKIDGKERLAIRSIRELPDSSSEDEAKLTSGEEDEEDGQRGSGDDRESMNIVSS